MKLRLCSNILWRLVRAVEVDNSFTDERSWVEKLSKDEVFWSS